MGLTAILPETAVISEGYNAGPRLSLKLLLVNSVKNTAPTDSLVETFPEYDAIGRLRKVFKDGTLVEEYRYNQNGARTYALRGITGRSFEQSDEDHLLTAGAVQYQYNEEGFLTAKTNLTNSTSYIYSSPGELLHVALPNGTVIDYVHDPLGRRIAEMCSATNTFSGYKPLKLQRFNFETV